VLIESCQRRHSTNENKTRERERERERRETSSESDECAHKFFPISHATYASLMSLHPKEQPTYVYCFRT
jgi:hypothetical protein